MNTWTTRKCCLCLSLVTASLIALAVCTAAAANGQQPPAGPSAWPTPAPAVAPPFAPNVAPSLPPPDLWGGPDSFGYTYADSDEPSGPDPTFEDISAFGALVTFAGPYYGVALPFAFPYYGTLYTQVYLYGDCLNCYSDYTHLSFGDPGSGDRVYWLDWIDRDSGPVYVYSDTVSSPARFIVQYEVWNYNYGFNTTSQLILYDNGDILIRYLDDFSAWQSYSGSGIPWLNNAYGSLGYAGYLRNNLAVQFYYPEGAWLWPPAQNHAGPIGGQATLTFDLHNDTGAADSFGLAVTPGLWPATVSPSQTGLISDGATVPVVVTIAVPPGASPGDVDAAVLQAASLTAPGVYSDTAVAGATAVCSPALTFGGQSALATGLDDIYRYAGQAFTYAHIDAHTTTGWNSMEGYVLGYNPNTQSWEYMVNQWYGGPDYTVLDAVYVPPIYTAVRVFLHDYSDAPAYYRYQFVVCREPAVGLEPPYQEQFAAPGATAVYTQVLTNYTLASDRFELSVEDNAWPTTFWAGGLPITTTPELADLQAFTFTVRVDVPPGTRGSGDDSTLRAAAVAQPALSATAGLQTAVLAYPWTQTYGEDWAPDGSDGTKVYADLIAAGATVERLLDGTGQVERSVAVAPVPRDRLVYAWFVYDWGSSVDVANILYTALDVDGDPIIPPTHVSDNSGAPWEIYDYGPRLAVSPVDGRVAFAWYRIERIGNDYRSNVYFAVRDAAGAVIVPPTAVTTDTTSIVTNSDAQVAAFGNGNLAVAWSRYDGASGTNDVYYTVFDGQGNTVKPITNLTNNPPGVQNWTPNLSPLADGNVLVNWNPDVWYTVLDPAGGVLLPPSTLSYSAYDGDAVGLANGHTLVAWMQYYPQGTQITYRLLGDDYLPIAAAAVLTNTHAIANNYVSATRDGAGNAVLTWVDGGASDRLYYAVVGDTGTVRTRPMIYRRARNDWVEIPLGAANGQFPLPALGIAKTAAPDPVAAGALLTYTLAVHNSGLVPATAVLVTDTVPADTTFAWADNGGVFVGDQVRWTGLTLAPGDILTLTFAVTVDVPLNNGTLLVNDRYAAACAEGISAAGSPLTTVVASAPVLSIGKTAWPDPVMAGSMLTYTLWVENGGNATATAVVVGDAIPDDTTFAWAGNGGVLVGDHVQWAGFTLAPGDTLTLTFAVTVDDDLPSGSVVLNATYAAACDQVTEPVFGPPVTTTVVVLYRHIYLPIVLKAKAGG